MLLCSEAGLGKRCLPAMGSSPSQRGCGKRPAIPDAQTPRIHPAPFEAAPSALEVAQKQREHRSVVLRIRELRIELDRSGRAPSCNYSSATEIPAGRGFAARRLGCSKRARSQRSFRSHVLPGERFLESPDDTQCIAAFVVRGESRRVQSDSLIVWQNRALIILRRCTRFAAAVLTSSNTLGALDSRVGAEYAQDASTAERRHDPRR